MLDLLGLLVQVMIEIEVQVVVDFEMQVIVDIEIIVLIQITRFARSSGVDFCSALWSCSALFCGAGSN